MAAGAERIYRVGISGSYGGMNLGDEAILQVIVTELRRSLPVEITIFSRDTEDTLARHGVERAVPVREMSRQEILPEIQRLDLLILGGGGILYDTEVRVFLREVLMAHEAGVSVMVYAVGAGPLKESASQLLVREALNRAAAITVRDRRSYQLLEEAGVQREMVVTADPAFLLEPAPLPRGILQREGVGSGARRLVGISVREPGPAAPDIDEGHYHSLLANTADYVVDRLDADLVLVPMEPRTLDLQHSHAVIARMANAKRATVLRGDYSSGQILSLVGRFCFVLGMRLHFLTFAALKRVPFVALPYASKVQAVVEMLGMDDQPFQRLPMAEMNIGRLIAHIDRAWDYRQETRSRINRSLSSVQERVRENTRIAVDLLTGRSEGRKAA